MLSGRRYLCEDGAIVVFKRFASILLCWIFRELPLYRVLSEVFTEIEMRELVFRLAVIPWQHFYGEFWDCRFTLAISFDEI